MKRALRILKFAFDAFGAAFAFVSLGLFAAALAVGGMFTAYDKGLPSHEALASYRPPTISRIYSGEGTLIDEFAKERRIFVPSEEIPDLVKHAFISAEDKNFYDHGGYDLRGIVAAGVEAVRTRGQTLRGASTIPQQVVKNFLLDGSRRAERKIKEIILATRLERTLSKEQILELYLNEIFLGQNSYGVAAAAQTYFNKTLDDLVPHEAAFLAAMPKAPSDYHPVREKSRLTDRRNFVLREMRENGYLSEEEYVAERAQPTRSVQNGDFEGFRASLPPRSYFTDEIRRQLSEDFGDGEFFTGGFAIRSTLDEELQVEATLALQRALEAYDRLRAIWRGTGLAIPAEELGDEAAWREALAEAEVPRSVELGGRWHPAVVLEVAEQRLTLGIEDVPEPGVVPRADIKWMRGDFFANFEEGDVVLARRATGDEAGADAGAWSVRQVPEVQGAFAAMDVETGRVIAMQGGFSYQDTVFNRATQARRQPGSSFKPFVYAAALDSGYSPATVLVDAPIEIDTPQGLWRPKNASDRYLGPTPMRTGIERSRNLMTIRLAREIGMDTVTDYAERFGVYDQMDGFLANSLGAQETTLYRMIAAYAMFANGGVRVDPTLVDRVQDRFGRTIYRHDQRICLDCDSRELSPGRMPGVFADRVRVMDAITAYQLTSMMEGVVERGTASRTVNLPVPAAGKTGTTNEARDVWFIGFTSNIVAGCYIGYDLPKPLGRIASGGGMCGPVFQSFMERAVGKYGGGPFSIPPGGRFMKIDRYTGGRLPLEAEGENVVEEYFRNGEDPRFGLTFDGGFAIGQDLLLEEEAVRSAERRAREGRPPLEPETPEDGEDRGSPASFGEISSGGLY